MKTQKKTTEITEVPKEHSRIKKVLKPLLADFCWNPTKTDVEIMPPLIRKNTITETIINTAIPTIKAKKAKIAPIKSKETIKSSSFLKESMQ